MDPSVFQKGPATEVDHRTDQRLVHRHIRMAVPPDPFLRPQRLGKRLPQRDPRVLHRVMEIHLNISVRLDLQIHQAVPRQKRQHVVKKRDLRPDHALSSPFHGELDGNLRLLGLTLDACAAGHRVFARHSQAPLHEPGQCPDRRVNQTRRAQERTYGGQARTRRLGSIA